jgi:hypothetical protein
MRRRRKGAEEHSRYDERSGRGKREREREREERERKSGTHNDVLRIRLAP